MRIVSLDTIGKATHFMDLLERDNAPYFWAGGRTSRYPAGFLIVASFMVRYYKVNKGGGITGCFWAPSRRAGPPKH